MKTYSYAFGDHTLFLRKGFTFPSIWRAHCVRGGTEPLLYIYVGARYQINADVLNGGELVMTIEWPPLIQTTLSKHWKSGQVIRQKDVLSIIERYVRRLVCCRLKEQV